MTQSFLACDREQVLLLPPSLREWLPEDHFAWFVIAAVEAMDLAAFYAAYRADGYGRPAHDPAMMVALLVYAYARGQRSSRVIERGCVEDIAFRVIAANQAPDHCTIARFRQRHETALAELFGGVLTLCAEAGLVGVGVVAVDGTKVHANASSTRRATTSRSRARSSRDADAVDAAEDEQFGIAAATSCRPSWRPRRVGAGGCARPSAASTPSAQQEARADPARRARSE